MIDKLMRLAALKLEADERRMLKDNLDRIVALIDAMQSADTDGVEPLDHPLDGVQPLRPDRVTEDVDRDRFQGLAPAARDGLYLVPRVVDAAATGASANPPIAAARTGKRA
ncbi:MAG: Asp-tRNA(Asn)/Glu-tRNA(Gln) amidotransferase subunit GatC [Gammaproteobacteria bacterium]|nr:Asp-tRNA(Asn)/Glu-tRNA(Gln) amidotransferase subunit GatC [Gammaproteobacteria bacterium]